MRLVALLIRIHQRVPVQASVLQATLNRHRLHESLLLLERGPVLVGLSPRQESQRFLRIQESELGLGRQDFFVLEDATLD